MRPLDYELLKQTPLYAAVGKESIDRVVRDAIVQSAPKGAVLFEEGDEAQFVHIILAGQVGLVAGGSGRAAKLIEFFNAGEIFVAPAAILNLRLLVSARVTHDARIVMIPAEKFRHAVAHDHALAVAMVAVLAKHWRLLIRQIKDLKLRSTAERLAAYLLTLIPEAGGPATLKLAEERKLLAGRLGMTPETLSRAFVQLRKLGVSSRGRQVQIASVRQLRDFCGFDDLI